MRPVVTCTLTFGLLLVSCGGSPPPANYPPEIKSFDVQPDQGTAPLAVTINCRAQDPDGMVVEYQYDFEGDGRVDFRDRFGVTTHTYGKGGTYRATCIAVDDLGAKSRAVKEVMVQDFSLP